LFFLQKRKEAGTAIGGDERDPMLEEARVKKTSTP